MQSFNQFISNAEFRNSISNMLHEENNSVLLETIINDTRTKDTKDDLQAYIQLNYQSIYLHIKGLSQLYLIQGDVSTSRRLLNLNSQLATALNQQQSFQFRK
jgi:hypothetical protein